MCKSWLTVLCFFVLMFVACAPDSKLAADQIAQISTATVYNENEQLFVRYDLSSFHEELTFLTDDTPQRSLAWSPQDDSFNFDGKNLERYDGQPFDNVVFKLKQDNQFYDRKYVVIDKIGSKSWSLYLPAFVLSGQKTEIEFQSDDPLDVRIGSQGHSLNSTYKIDSQKIMSYFGQPKFVRISEFTIVAGSDVPEWLIEKVRSNVSATISILESSFKMAPVNRPTLYFTTGASDIGPSIKGGQLDQAVMTFRYRGVNFAEFSEEFINNTANTAAHEAAHLWIGGHYINKRNNLEPWMSEGGAEYLSDRTRNTNAQIDLEFESRLNNCLKKLGKQNLNGSTAAVQGGEAYDCGYVLHVAAESITMQRTGSDIIDVWSKMIADLGQDISFFYEPIDFLEAVEKLGGPDYKLLAAPFLEGTSENRWEELERLFENVGITIQKNSALRYEDTQLLTISWLVPLLASNCSGSYGFYIKEDAIKLDAKSCNPPLVDGLLLKSIGKYHVIKHPFEAFGLISQKCTQENPLVFVTHSGEALPEIRCDFSLTPIPPAFKLIKKTELRSLNAK